MPETRFAVGIADWVCHLVLDATLASQLSIPSTESGLPPTSEIRITHCDGLPEIAWTHAQSPADLSAMFHSPEARRFQPVPDLVPPIYTDSVLAGGPALELRDGALRVLHPERWPLYMELVITWLMLRESSLVSLHAAVCAINDTALVLLGSSGVGKSTLAAALAAQGADYYDDESAFFDQRDGRLYARQGKLGLRPDGRSLLDSPPTGLLYEAKAGDPKYAASLTPPTRPCPQDRVQLFFLDGFGASPSLTPMPGGEASLRLVRGMGHGDPSLASRLEAGAEIVTHYPSYRLRVGPPDATARMLLSFAAQPLLPQ